MAAYGDSLAQTLLVKRHIFREALWLPDRLNQKLESFRLKSAQFCRASRDVGYLKRYEAIIRQCPFVPKDSQDKEMQDEETLKVLAVTAEAYITFLIRGGWNSIFKKTHSCLCQLLLLKISELPGKFPQTFLKFMANFHRLKATNGVVKIFCIALQNGINSQAMSYTLGLLLLVPKVSLETGLVETYIIDKAQLMGRQPLLEPFHQVFDISNLQTMNITAEKGFVKLVHCLKSMEWSPDRMLRLMQLSGILYYRAQIDHTAAYSRLYEIQEDQSKGSKCATLLKLHSVIKQFSKTLVFGEVSVEQSIRRQFIEGCTSICFGLLQCSPNVASLDYYYTQKMAYERKSKEHFGSLMNAISRKIMKHEFVSRVYLGAHRSLSQATGLKMTEGFNEKGTLLNQM